MILLLPLLSALAQTAAPARRPRVGLALSGGGALGMSHIGVLKALEEMRIPIDYIAGTSAGGLVGGLYAAGMSAAEIEEIALTLDLTGSFNDDPPRRELSLQRKEADARYLSALTVGFRGGRVALPPGLSQGQRQNLIFKELTARASHVGDFDDLPIPFRCVAADLATGEPVILGEGDLGEAMRATMSVPGLLAPARVGGRELVDGGAANNLPIDVVRAMGADVVIAVNFDQSGRADVPSSFVGISGRVMRGVVDRSTRAQLATLTESDALIVPDLAAWSVADYDAVDAIIPQGYRAARAMEGRLRPLALDEAAWKSRWEAQTREPPPPPAVAFLRVRNGSRLNDAVIAAHFRQPLGEPLDVKLLGEDIERLYGLGVFEWISYSIVEEGGAKGLEIEAREKRWGPQYLSFGLSLQDNLQGANSYSLLLGHRWLALNGLGGELSTDLEVGERYTLGSELYQPITRSLRYFIAPHADVSRLQTQPTDLPGYTVTVYEGSAGLDVGRDFAHLLEARLGYGFSYAYDIPRQSEASTSIPDEGPAGGGLSASPEPDLIRYAGPALKLKLDSLDDAYFPRSGAAGEAEVDLYRTALGSDADLVRAEGNLGGAASWRRHTLTAYGEYGWISEELPSGFENLGLGALFRLSGYPLDTLIGERLVFGRLGYRYQLARGSRSLSTPVYAGLTAEAGEVQAAADALTAADLIYAGSLYLGAETLLGPLYFAYGRTDGGQDSLYLFLGRVL